MAVNYLFKFGTVISVDDKEDGGRVRVYIRGEDPTNYKITDIPYAFPLLPKHLYVKPKNGEQVFVLSQDGSFSKDRFWIGPIISQPHKLGYETTTSDAFLQTGVFKADVPPSSIPENRGVQPSDDDIAILGRGSTDIIQKKNEVRIRAGKSLDFKTLNTLTPSYIQVKHDINKDKGQINIVANDINLLSHDSVTKFNLSNPESLITDEEFDKIIAKAHALPFGDVLVEFLTLMKKAFLTHVHAYHGLAPDLDQTELKNYINFNMDKILSKNIRIN